MSRTKRKRKNNRVAFDMPEKEIVEERARKNGRTLAGECRHMIRWVIQGENENERG